MAKIKIGTINVRELDKKIRRTLPQTEKTHGSKKGQKGYNRARDKRAKEKGDG